VDLESLVTEPARVVWLLTRSLGMSETGQVNPVPVDQAAVAHEDHVGKTLKMETFICLLRWKEILGKF
jgi:hypothetical protein